MNHPRLQELFSLGIIDFAVVDAEADIGSVGGGTVGEELQGEGVAANGEEVDSDGEVRGLEAHEGGVQADGGGGRDEGGGALDGQARGVGLWRSGCLRLELSGEEIRPGEMEHPMIVVANYVFDSLKQDAFR